MILLSVDRPDKIVLFAVSICFGLLTSYLCYRMTIEVNRALPNSKQLSIVRGLFVVIAIHRKYCPESKLRAKAILCLTFAFILFVLSADAVL